MDVPHYDFYCREWFVRHHVVSILIYFICISNKIFHSTPLYFLHNNVLGFPFIFRGALDVRARQINENMKLAATMALAELARRGEAVPKAVRDAYPSEVFDFGPGYIIPKPFDPRILIYVPLAVAQAAMESGVARVKLDLVEYRKRLEETVGDIASQ